MKPEDYNASANQRTPNNASKSPDTKKCQGRTLQQVTERAGPCQHLGLRLLVKVTLMNSHPNVSSDSFIDQDKKQKWGEKNQKS